MGTNSHHQLVRVAGWFAYASGVIAISGLLPFVTFFVFGVNIPGLNDSAAIVQYLLALPIMWALHPLMQARAPLRSKVAMLSGIVGISAFVVVQVLWLFESIGVTTYYLLIGTAMFMVGTWLVTTGYALRRSTGPQRRSPLLSILAATYFAYPIWAIWLGRLLLADKLTKASPATKGETA